MNVPLLILVIIVGIGGIAALFTVGLDNYLRKFYLEVGIVSAALVVWVYAILILIRSLIQ